MCGFVGCLHGNQDIDKGIILDDIKNMNIMIAHRGPDDEGYFQDDDITMGFRRLSIIDLKNGHQPLSYENERYWIVFNGEIYNFKQLQKELMDMGFTFQTTSDTEVLIAYYVKYGVEICSKLRGMFAFVIWDKEEKILFGARDFFGIKPFYYTTVEEKLYFASEKKAFINLLPKGQINKLALQNYLSFQYVPQPQSIIPNVNVLMPGHYFIKKENSPVEIIKYFHATFTPITDKKKQDIIIDIGGKLKSAIFDSVEKHMSSDVPVGAFLSGGIDSSIITAIASKLNPKLITFSVGFDIEGYNEMDFAQETADLLKVDFNSYIITPKEFMKEFASFVWAMDEPLADPAAIPQYFVAREASKKVKVILSGEGADEIFAGYTIYNEPNSLRVFNYMPKKLHKAIRQMTEGLSEEIRGCSFLKRGSTSLEERYIGNAKIFEEFEKENLLKNYVPKYSYQKITQPYYVESKDADPISRMQLIDINLWLNGDLLLNADRTTMIHGLELRTPFLDKKIFEIARKIPANLRVAHGTTKYMLRQAVKDILPKTVVTRKKLGFPVPIRIWLKNEMYDWAKNMISESQTDYLFHKNMIFDLLEEHCIGKRDNSRKIWTVLSFMQWHKLFIEESQV